MKNTLSPSKINEITYAIQQLWIHQNKSLPQATKEVLSRYDAATVQAYLASEREDDRRNAAASDSAWTY